MGKWIRKSGLLVWTLVVAITVTACSSGDKKESGLASLDREDSGSLKVAYFNEQAFYMQYGNAFQAMFPNVELTVVSLEPVFEAEDPVAEMEKLLNEQQPDVLYLGDDQYTSLANKGLLYDLDAVVKQDEFDIDAFLPSVIELLKAKGGGKLYGLSPDFTSQALYYNKGIFDQHGIPYPTDGMSWEEVMQLAARFPVKKDGDDALFGLFQSSSTSNPYELINTIGEAKGLLFADVDAKTVSIDSPEWKQIFQSVIEGYKTGSLSMPSENGGGEGVNVMRSVGGKTTVRIGGDSMKFMSGQAAMTIDGPMLMNMMGMEMKMGAAGAITSSKSDTGDSTSPKAPKSPFKDIDWDVVTIPVDPSQPDVTSSMGLENVFSINAASENLSAAWEFLKTSSMSSPGLSARTAFKKEVEGKNVEAFYALGANSQLMLQALPEEFIKSFAQLAADQIKKAVDGTQTVDQIIATLQTQGQDLLTKAIVEAEE